MYSTIINSYEAKKPSLQASRVKCRAPDGPTGLHRSTRIPQRSNEGKQLNHVQNKNKTKKKQLPVSPLAPVGRTWWERALLRKHFFPSFKSFAFRRWGSHRRRETLSPGKKNKTKKKTQRFTRT